MGDARLIRTVRFRASHHYRRTDWSDDENHRVFGAQSQPHEHAWCVEFHVSGPIDAATGWAVDLGALDAAVAEVTAGWDGGDLNAAIPGVRAGAWTPSTENLARWLYDTLRGRVGDPARLVEVRVFESSELGSVYPG